jgi:HD-GYP domain-containing protein (c-di-GMP phosphodiesterase class II)
MDPWREAAMEYGFASSISLPLKHNGDVFGVLNIYAAETDAFGDDEIRLLEEMAGDLAFGIATLHTRHERDQAIAESQHYYNQMRTGLEQAVDAIATTLEMRDPYTAGHQRRVADLAAAIAHELRLPEEQVQAIHLAGTVHDLGKIHIPAEILTKPGKLTELEYKFIKTHPQAGYDILKGIDFPWPVAQMVLQHHERLDGSGYPGGLKDGEIILEARILAVADVVEAMFSHRPYRAGLGLEAALAEITGNRGKLFDPAVVDACVKLLRQRGYSLS